MFEEGRSKISEALAVMEQVQKNEGEYNKMLEYSKQIAPAMREISKSAYVQQLTKEYIKNHKWWLKIPPKILMFCIMSFTVSNAHFVPFKGILNQ